MVHPPFDEDWLPEEEDDGSYSEDYDYELYLDIAYDFDPEED